VTRLRSVFFGTPDFALPSLEAALAHSEVIGVVTQPDRPRGRGQQVLACPVKTRAIEAKVPVFSPASLRKDSEERSRLLDFFSGNPVDLFCVTAYGNLLPEPILTLPRFGCVNVHASLLPRWRGAAPIQRALEAGDSESGVCLQKMVLEMDAGAILSEKKISLGPDIQASELTNLLSCTGGELLAEFLGRFQGGVLQGWVQDPIAITLAPKIRKEEGFWDPSWSARELHNKTRAFGVWPGLKARLETGIEFKFSRTRLLPVGDLPPLAEPGVLFLHLNRVFLKQVRSSEFGLEVLEIQPANKGVLKAYDFFQNEARKSTPGQSALRLLKPQM